MSGFWRFAGGCLLVVVPVVGLLEMLQPSVVRGASMLPALHDGDRIVVERFTPLFGALSRGDIVVLHPPSNDDERYVKRIAALPGDVVRMEKGELWIGRDRVLVCEADRNLTHTWVIPEGHCFVLGDNTERSFDSRLFGPVPMARVIGRVLGS